jgi:hypothetical protein
MSHNFPVSTRLLAAIGVAMAIAMSATTVTAAPDQSPPARYDLRYSVTDDRLQIFDDGVNTRMLLPEGTQIPLVRTFKSGAEQLVVLQREAGTQFILIPGLHHKLIMTWPGQRHVNVSYQGNAHQAARAGANVAYGAAPVAAAHGLAATPMLPPAPSQDPGVSGQAAPVVPSAAARTAVAASETPAAGVPGAPEGRVGTPAPSAWEVRTADVHLENTFKRWAQLAGYQLLWDTDRQVLIPATDSFAGSLPEAINRVLTSPAIRHSDHPLEAVIYSNNPPLIRITRLGEQQIQE